MIAKGIVAAVVGAAALIAASPPVTAAPALRTVASGLDNPRGIAFGPRGELYVAESGRGGPGPCQAGPEGGQVCFGRSGAITVLAAGRQWRVATGLPSLASPAGTEASGPSDVSVGADGRLHYTVGLGGSPDLRTRVPQLAGTAKLYRAGRTPVVLADLGEHERSANPDGVTPPDTNPTAVLTAKRGQLVVDAGGNSLLRVAARGRVATVAVFGARTVPGPDGTPVRMESVPTSVARGPDGALYVGELTGFPFPPGQARIWRIAPGQAPRVWATGFTNVIDLAWAPDGRLYVLEIAHRGLLSGDRTGALIRVDRDGGQRVVASAGLTAPGGLAVRGRYAYVSNCSVCAGTGSVVRIGL
ncbi:ScyD/ScyE family protein [Actinoplanes sp. DH11]|uniref:ScyD/ScyE family protein n=1 Tax=Actinoplanes sp. DH11 TaxID=2857011 RepID=UPI001E49213E|nr:ScyD/ScyE family protein [Actinoplanes sp. DH11]